MKLHIGELATAAAALSLERYAEEFYSDVECRGVNSWFTNTVALLRLHSGRVKTTSRVL